MQNSPLKICLTGSIACGKSLFSRCLNELGVETLDADDVVHALEAAGGAAVEPVRERFGAGVLNDDGSVNRRILAGLVFGEDESKKKNRRDLEAILFPMVRRKLMDFLTAEEGGSEREGKIRVAVVPLLFESHWEKDYDIILCVRSSVRNQVERMIDTRGYSADEAKARLASQMSVSEKAARSDYVIDNDGDSAQLLFSAQQTVEWLKEKIRYGRNKS